MKKFVIFTTLVVLCATAWATSDYTNNLGLERPAKDDSDWHLPLRANWITLDVAVGAQHSGQGYHTTISPDADATRDLGATTYRFRNLYISGAISNDTNNVTISTLTTTQSKAESDARYVNITADSRHRYITADQGFVWVTSDVQYRYVTADQGFIYVTGDTMTGVLSMSNNINPTANNSRDLGTSSLKWKDIWLAGDIVVENVSSDLKPGTANTYSLGTSTQRWKDVWVTGDAVIHRVSSDLIPGKDATYNLGNNSFGWKSMEFRDTSTGDTISIQKTGNGEAISIDMDGNAACIKIDTEAPTGTPFMDVDFPGQTNAVTFMHNTAVSGDIVLKLGPAYIWATDANPAPILRIADANPTSGDAGQVVGQQ